MARCHPEWKVISVRYFNPAGNHHSGLIGDNPLGSIPGNLFSVIQEVIIGKRELITVFGSDYNTFDGSGVRDFVHVVDLGTNSSIQPRDILRLCSIWTKWSREITMSLILAQETGSVCCRWSRCSKRFFSKRSTTRLETGDLEIWRDWWLLQSRLRASWDGSLRRVWETCARVVSNSLFFCLRLPGRKKQIFDHN